MNQKQCKMARIGLGWTRSFLAEKAGVAPEVVVNYESGVITLETCVNEIRRTLMASNRVTFEGNCSVFIAHE